MCTIATNLFILQLTDIYMAEKTLVGKIVHFFPNVSVAVVKLDAALKAGDQIEIGGKTEPFQQTVDSMQVEHKAIAAGKKGQEVALKTDKQCKDGDMVYRV